MESEGSYYRLFQRLGSNRRANHGAEMGEVAQTVSLCLEGSCYRGTDMGPGGRGERSPGDTGPGVDAGDAYDVSESGGVVEEVEECKADSHQTSAR